MFRKTVPFVALMLACAAAAFAQTEEKTFPLGAKGTVQVATVAGSVHVKAVDSPGTVTVRATVNGKYVKPVYTEKDGVLSVREEHDEKAPRNASHGSVDFEVLVPRAAVLEVKSVSGSVACEGTTGAQTLKTVSGEIRSSSDKAAALTLASVSGKVVCTVTGAGPASLKVKNVSGDVEVALPSRADAKVSLQSLSGKVVCPDTLQKSKGHVGTTCSGNLGGGQNSVCVESVSGDITLR